MAGGGAASQLQRPQVRSHCCRSQGERWARGQGPAGFDFGLLLFGFGLPATGGTQQQRFRLGGGFFLPAGEALTCGCTLRVVRGRALVLRSRSLG